MPQLVSHFDAAHITSVAYNKIEYSIGNTFCQLVDIHGLAFVFTERARFGCRRCRVPTVGMRPQYQAVTCSGIQFYDIVDNRAHDLRRNRIVVFIRFDDYFFDNTFFQSDTLQYRLGVIPVDVQQYIAAVQSAFFHGTFYIFYIFYIKTLQTIACHYIDEYRTVAHRQILFSARRKKGNSYQTCNKTAKNMHGLKIFPLQN